MPGLRSTGVACLLAFSGAGTLASGSGRQLLQNTVSVDDTITTALDSFLTTVLGLNGNLDLADVLPKIDYGVDVTTPAPFPGPLPGRLGSAVSGFLGLPAVRNLGHLAGDLGLSSRGFNLTGLQRFLPEVNASQLVDVLQVLAQPPNASEALYNGLNALVKTPLAQDIGTAIFDNLPPQPQPLRLLGNLGEDLVGSADGLFFNFTRYASHAVATLRSDFGLPAIRLPNLRNLNLTLPELRNLNLSLPNLPTSLAGNGTIPLPGNGSVGLTGSIDWSDTLKALDDALGINLSTTISDTNSLISSFESGGLPGFAAELDTILASLMATLLQRASSDASGLPNIGDVLNNLPGLSGIENFVNSLAHFDSIDDLPNLESALEKIFLPFCTPPSFSGQDKVPTSFVGGRLVLELVPFQCQLDDAAKVLACTPAYLQVSLLPAELTVVHKSGASWTGLECKLEKALGKDKVKQFGGQLLAINVKEALASAFGPVADTVSGIDSEIQAVVKAAKTGTIGSLQLPSLASDLSSAIDRSISITPYEPEINFGLDVNTGAGGAPAPGPSKEPAPQAPEAAPMGEAAPKAASAPL